MNTLDISAELSIKMLHLEKAIDMGLPYTELKKIYTEIKELQLQAILSVAKQRTRIGTDLVIE